MPWHIDGREPVLTRDEISTFLDAAKKMATPPPRPVKRGGQSEGRRYGPKAR